MEPGVGGSSRISAVSYRAVMFLMLLILLGNFATFLWHQKYESRGTFSDTHLFADKKNGSGLWKPFEIEKKLYEAEGYDYSWLQMSLWPKLDVVTGSYSPFFKLITLRMYGIIVNIPYMICIVLFFLLEGRVRYKKKHMLFENISSTKYHLLIRLGTFFTVLTVCLYCTFPFGSFIPWINISIPLSFELFGYVFWVASPLIWALSLLSILSGVAYVVGSNFSSEI